ncbi:flavodoxin-dependent (E)-4-hydroxy-3-methylbut-2-enyl-diphosphate synthase [Bacillus sp. SL00103]
MVSRYLEYGDWEHTCISRKDPVMVKVARELLKSFALAANAATLISCPTCGRIEIDLISTLQMKSKNISPQLKHRLVAVLGCAVNGPGSA